MISLKEWYWTVIFVAGIILSNILIGCLIIFIFFLVKRKSKSDIEANNSDEKEIDKANTTCELINVNNNRNTENINEYVIPYYDKDMPLPTTPGTEININLNKIEENKDIINKSINLNKDANNTENTISSKSLEINKEIIDNSYISEKHLDLPIKSLETSKLVEIKNIEVGDSLVLEESFDATVSLNNSKFEESVIENSFENELEPNISLEKEMEIVITKGFDNLHKDSENNSIKCGPAI